jgi:caffeoyl-CoA O-methyltransferase
MGKMIEDLEGYFRTLVPAREELLLDLEKEAREEGIPIIGPVVGRLLMVLVGAIGARPVLELGTANGYSAVYLARACQGTGGRLLTLEWDPEMAERARANLGWAGLSEVAEVRTGDALKLMDNLEESFGLIFMDIDKEYYRPALPHCRRLLKPGGLLLVDNTGFRGAADFNQAIFEDDRWLAVNLLCFLPDHSPEQDGLLLALRK